MKNHWKKIIAILTVCAFFCCVLPALGASAEEPEGGIIVYSDLYLRVLDALQNNLPDESGFIEVDVSGLTVTLSDFAAVCKQASCQNPEYCYFRGSYAYYPGEMNGYLSAAWLACQSSGEELQNEMEELDALIAPLVALRDENWSDLETVLFYHDYLSSNYEYDLQYRNYFPKEFLSEGKGVCNAYTLTFQMLMRVLQYA